MTEFETASLALMELNIWFVAIVGGLQCLLIGGGITAMLWANWVRSKQQDENSAALRELIEEGREQRRESSEALRLTVAQGRESTEALQVLLQRQ